MKELILATGNLGKVAEFQAMLAPIQCLSQKSLGIESVEETGLSFIENAILKARHASRLAQKPALADDSGLVVPALHGEPGIYSARFAGSHATDHDNIKLLLEKMASIPTGQRQAFFYCALALVQHAEDPTPIIATGKLEGLINKEALGANGFGYDPIFYLTEYHCTVAQLEDTVKNSISHRALALKQLHAQIIS